MSIFAVIILIFISCLSVYCGAHDKNLILIFAGVFVILFVIVGILAITNCNESYSGEYQYYPKDNRELEEQRCQTLYFLS